MNTRLVARQLGLVCLLIGAFMVLSLPWAHPELGVRYHGVSPSTDQFERAGFFALLTSLAVSMSVGVVLLWVGRNQKGKLYRKEAMAVVGLSWVLATVLGALPFYFGQCARGTCVRLDPIGQQAFVLSGVDRFLSRWKAKPLDNLEYPLVESLVNSGFEGLSDRQLAATAPTATRNVAGVLDALMASDPDWAEVLLQPNQPTFWGTSRNYRLRVVPMTFVDTLFESQSGFSTTGATVITDLENSKLVPHCLLFWRSSTHFLGGLGIIVLFVVILGQGSAGKALMQAELPGPTQDSPQARMQHAAWLFAGTYVILNVVLAAIMRWFGMSWFDSLCHTFGTMATGGFSTYNASLGHFDNAALEYVTVLFMILAGSNFTLLIFFFRGKPLVLLRDLEWRSYLGIIVLATILVVSFGMAHSDFGDAASDLQSRLASGVRYGLFQVVSIMTTTGFGTHDFDHWNELGRAVLFGLMFVGGCAGSTGGGLKVIRVVLMAKILRQEVELSFRPTVIRPLRVGGKPINDPHLKKNVLVYIAIVMLLFVGSWYFVLLVEPDATWGPSLSHKLVDTASAVAAMLNNIGPGLGTVGPTQNYAHLSAPTKLLFTWLMMLGRVEVFVILCLFAPRFWRNA